MIKGWKIIELNREDQVFDIEAEINWDDDCKKEYSGLTQEEWETLTTWFCGLRHRVFKGDAVFPLTIVKVREIDMLGADFQVDVSELRKAAQELNMQW